MASIPFTLAALATSAVSGLVITGVRGHDEDADSAAAIVTTDRGELLVRVPRSQAAEILQSAELLGLAALTDGPRSHLPFEVPRTLGLTRAGETRAVVSTYPEGSRIEVADLQEDALLLAPFAEMLAAIHSLPRTVAQNGGLPVREARDLRVLTDRLVCRAEQTRMLPEIVLRRWRNVLETAEVWDFTPLMVHGTLDANQLRVDEDRVVAVVGWSELSVGDPAADFAWLFAAGPEVFDGVLSRYASLRNPGSPAQLRTRAALYHELEVARWLLHGIDAHDQEIIDDAVAMLDRLVGSGGVLDSEVAAQISRGPLGEAEAEALLEETPEVVDHLSDTAAYEALDEDRMFGVDRDFLASTGEDDEPDATGSDAAVETAEAAAADPGTDPAADIESGTEAEVDAEAGADEQLTEQITEPFDPEDLPGLPKR